MNLITMIFEVISTGIMCTLYIISFVVVSQLGLLAFNIWHKKQQKPTSNDASGLIFGAISLIYSLILAFVIVAVWTDYEDLTVTIEKETDKINNILAHSMTLPDTLKQPITVALTGYCTRVINQEWSMRQTTSRHYPSAIPSLRQMLLRTEPENKLQEGIYAVIDDDLSNISDLRRERLDHTRSHVPGIVWLILKLGCILTIGFTYFLEAPSMKLKRIYLVFLSSMMAMSLYLVNALDDPFNGSVAVSKQPYENILIELKEFRPLPDKKIN